MATSSIQGQLLEVSVTRCTNLKNTEWISRQDPYVSLGYGSTNYRTRTNTDGGTDPVFQDKFMFVLIEGLKEMKVEVYNSNIMKHNEFIGGGTLNTSAKGLSQGFDETAWPLHTQTGRHAGEVGITMRYSQANNSATSNCPSAPPNAYGASPLPNGPPYSAPPPCTACTASYAHSPAPSYQLPYPYPAAASYSQTPASSYQSPSPYPAAASYSQSPASSYQSPSPYPPAVYPPPPVAYPYNPSQQAACPPPYAPPPTTYPPPPYPHTYPSYYSTGPYRGAYPTS